MNSLNVEIAAAQKRLDELIAKRDRPMPNEDDIWLAEKLHGGLCHYDHAEGCGWFYEVSQDVVDWYGQAHVYWLSRARETYNRIPEDISINDAQVVIASIFP